MLGSFELMSAVSLLSVPTASLPTLLSHGMPLLLRLHLDTERWRCVAVSSLSLFTRARLRVSSLALDSHAAADLT